RSKRDWSSDVCSSDLRDTASAAAPYERGTRVGDDPGGGGGRQPAPTVLGQGGGSSVRGLRCGGPQPGRGPAVHGRDASCLPVFQIGRASCRERLVAYR